MNTTTTVLAFPDRAVRVTVSCRFRKGLDGTLGAFSPTQILALTCFFFSREKDSTENLANIGGVRGAKASAHIACCFFFVCVFGGEKMLLLLLTASIYVCCWRQTTWKQTGG